MESQIPESEAPYSSYDTPYSSYIDYPVLRSVQGPWSDGRTTIVLCCDPIYPESKNDALTRVSTRMRFCPSRTLVDDKDFARLMPYLEHVATQITALSTKESYPYPDFLRDYFGVWESQWNESEKRRKKCVKENEGARTALETATGHNLIKLLKSNLKTSLAQNFESNPEKLALEVRFQHMNKDVFETFRTWGNDLTVSFYNTPTLPGVEQSQVPAESAYDPGASTQPTYGEETGESSTAPSQDNTVPSDQIPYERFPRTKRRALKGRDGTPVPPWERYPKWGVDY